MIRLIRFLDRSDTLQNVRAGSAAVVLLSAFALMVCGGASARTWQLDATNRHLADQRGEKMNQGRSGVASQPVPPAFLVAVAKRQAALLGERDPSSASFVLTTRGDFLARLGGRHRDDKPVYVLVLTGTFSHERHPPGAPPPLGTVALWIVDVATGQPTSFGLSNTAFDLTPLGPVGDLMPYLRSDLTPACGAADMQGRANFQGATQSLLGGISLTNRSSYACALPKGRPQVFLSWKGKRLDVEQRPLPPPQWKRSISVLKPKHRAIVILQWRNWCDPSPWVSTGFGPDVELVLGPGRGTLIVPQTDGGAPQCNSRPSTLRISPFLRRF
jgi:hypothetical protein